MNRHSEVDVDFSVDPTSISDLRRRLGLTQEQLGQVLGVHAVTVSKWERGTRPLPLYNLQQVWWAGHGSLNLTPEELAEFNGYLTIGFGAAALAFLVMRAARHLKERLR